MENTEKKYISLEKKFISLTKEYVNEENIWHTKSVYQLEKEAKEAKDREQKELEEEENSNGTEYTRYYSGMGSDISELAKINMALIAITALIAISFCIMTIAKSITTQGQASLQKGVDALYESSINQYDQSVVTGALVRSTINEFSSQNYSILVGTFLDNILLDKKIKKSQLANYGAVINDSLSDYIYLKDGAFITNDTFKLDSKNSIVRNNDVSATVKKGDKNYIKDSARFNSHLLKDESGQIVGVVFLQK